MYNYLATGSFLGIFCGPKFILLSLAVTQKACTKFVMACADNYKILPCRKGIQNTTLSQNNQNPYVLLIAPNPMNISISINAKI
jgi:hypothetical protein